MKLFISELPRAYSLPSRGVTLNGIAVPGLAVDRHGVGMARQHHAAAIVRADRGVEIGLAAVGVEIEFAHDAPAVEIIAHEIDQGEVAFAAGGVESDKPRDHVARR